MRLLIKHLARDGVLVSNFVSSEELRNSVYLSNEKITHRFASAFRFTTPLYENVVGAFLRTPSSSRFLRDQLKQIPLLDPTRKGSRLRYSIRSLK